MSVLTVVGLSTLGFFVSALRRKAVRFLVVLRLLVASLCAVPCYVQLSCVVSVVLWHRSECAFSSASLLTREEFFSGYRQPHTTTWLGGLPLWG